MYLMSSPTIDAAVVTFERSVYVLEEYTGTTLACTRPAGQLERDTTVVVFSVDNTAISKFRAHVICCKMGGVNKV